MICRRLLDIEKSFDQIEWQSTTYNVTQKGEVDSFFTWSEVQRAKSNNFVLQVYTGWSVGKSFRIAAADPRERSQSSSVIVVAKSTNESQIKQLMIMLEEVENLKDFDYEGFWSRLGSK